VDIHLLIYKPKAIKIKRDKIMEDMMKNPRKKRKVLPRLISLRKNKALSH